jgi:death on curing protein
MLSRELIDKLHELSLKRYGGSSGIRDEGMLESAIARPFQTFGGEQLYPTVFSKTAAIGQSLIMNHPYVDGNKRTGLLAMIAMLEGFGYELIAEPDETYQVTINISTGKIEFEDLCIWIEDNCRLIPT